MENIQQKERKAPKDMDRSELLIFVGQLMASARRKSKQLEALTVENEFLKQGGANRNFQKVLAGSKFTKPESIKQRTKGMSKQLKKLNGLL